MFTNGVNLEPLVDFNLQPYLYLRNILDCRRQHSPLSPPIFHLAEYQQAILSADPEPEAWSSCSAEKEGIVLGSAII